MYRLVLVVIPLLSFFSQRLSAQVDSSSNHIFSGEIIDDSLGYALPAVHIWNESTRMGCISNTSGEFSLKLRAQDTIVFSAIGYMSLVMVASARTDQYVVVRLRPKKYVIDEVVIRRFRSYESFKYQVLNLELPEERVAQLKEYINVAAPAIALEADRERAVNEKIETGRFGFITPLGKGINPEKAFKEKIRNLKMREEVINAKFNRVLVGDLTKLEGDELTEFIAHCDFSEEYLYETDLYAIIDTLYAKLNDYQNKKDTISNAIEQ